MSVPGPLTVQRVYERVITSRAIRAPNYLADHDEGVRVD